MTPAGFGIPIKRSKLYTVRHETPNFFRKNRGLIVNTDFWKMIGRLAVSRLQAPSRSSDEPVLFVATHHKVMTTYFTSVLRLLAFGLKLNYQKISTGCPSLQSELVLSMHSKFDPKLIGKYRGVHVMRDPRDIIVSGYYYHKWTHEDWVHRPDENGVSYQQKLNRADKRSGLFMEIDHFIYFYRDTLREWDMKDPNILEITYEGLMSDSRDDNYKNMFSHLGLKENSLDLAVNLMRLFESKTRTGGTISSTSSKKHLRSGRSGQWQNELDEDHLAYIEQELGTVLCKFGY